MSNSLESFFSNLKEINRLPIMFIGSGMAKRYTSNNFDWKGLLIKCISAYHEMPDRKYKWYIEKIKSEHNVENDSHMMYKLLGSYIQSDFNMEFYEGKFELEGIGDDQIPLKYFIKTTLENYSIKDEMKPELEMLRRLKDKMLTVITTNYDTFLEDYVFTSHEKIIKQQIFTGSELGTLMKIHGCVSEPDSMILTQNDYENYYKKSKVLAAKVINMFAENPVLFFGYSITDENIRDFLHDVYSCLETNEELDHFEKRLVIVDYDSSKSEPVIGPHTIDFNGTRINMSKISISDFSQLYQQMIGLKTFTQLREIRRLKNLVYDIVHDYQGEKKRVVNLMNDEEDGGDEVVVVIGRSSQVMELTGVTGVLSDQVFRDILYDDLASMLPIEIFVDRGLPQLLKGNSVIPVHKYLRRLPSEKDVILDKNVIEMRDKNPENLLTKSMIRDLDSYEEYRFNSLDEIYLSNVPKTKKLHFLLFWSIAALTEEIDEIREFLIRHYEELNANSRTVLRKLIIVLDIKENKESTPQG